MSKGCDVNAKDRVYYYFLLFSSTKYVSLKYENSALYYAVVNGRRKVAAYLITECGANVNDRNNVSCRVRVMISLNFHVSWDELF